MPRAILIALLCIAAALAGCQSPADDGTPTPTGGTPGTTPTSGGTPTPTAGTPISATEARAAFDDAVENTPTRVGMDMAATRNGTTLLTMEGDFDQTAGTAAVLMTMDPSLLEEEGVSEGADVFAEGFRWYTIGELTIFLVNDTAFVMDNSSQSPVDPSESPIGEFADPSWVSEDFEGEDVDVLDARATTHKGKSAVAMTLRVRDNETNETTDADVILYRNPARLARMEMDAPSEASSDDEPDPFAGARLVIDFRYDDEVAVELPTQARRVAGLAHTGTNPFGMGSGEGPYSETWTFTGDEDLALEEIEVQVKDPSGQSTATPSYGAVPTLWSMGLDEGSKSQDGVTITFTDADGSGTVSPGDTLEFTSEDGVRPTIVLYDTVTRTYVVPGPGALLALLAAALAIVLLGRRR